MSVTVSHYSLLGIFCDSRTIFEVDIDGFEEKPWKYPSVDVSDFFNFGLTEDSWKEYCKKLVIACLCIVVLVVIFDKILFHLKM